MVTNNNTISTHFDGDINKTQITLKGNKNTTFRHQTRQYLEHGEDLIESWTILHCNLTKGRKGAWKVSSMFGWGTRYLLRCVTEFKLRAFDLRPVGTISCRSLADGRRWAGQLCACRRWRTSHILSRVTWLMFLACKGNRK